MSPPILLEITGGVRISHSCSSCLRYDQKIPTKSIFVYNEVPYQPKWHKMGFEYTYEFADRRRKCIFQVKPFQGVLGYAGAADLPWVTLNKVVVGGRGLTSVQFELFRRLVNGF